MKKFSSTTKANSRHTSQGRKIKRVVIITVLGIALLFIVPKIVASLSSLILTPIHAVETWLAVSSDSFPQFVRDRAALLSELDTLRSKQSTESGDRLTADLLTQENAELRGLLGDSNSRRILAGVIGRPNKLPYDVLVLDKGQDDGIVEGAPVFIGNNAVIGIVDKVFNRSSIVELITTPGFVASVYIFGPNIYTNAVGIGGGQLRVGVPQGIKIEVGNVVVLPGVDSGVYGAIGAVDSVPTEPEQYGYVSPNVPLSGLRLVSVGAIPLEPVTFEQAEEVVSKVQKTAFAVPVPEHILVTTGNASTSATTTATTTATTSKKLP